MSGPNVWAVQTTNVDTRAYAGLRVIRMPEGLLPEIPPLEFLHNESSDSPQISIRRPPRLSNETEWVVDQLVPSWFILLFAEDVYEHVLTQPQMYKTEESNEVKQFYNKLISDVPLSTLKKHLNNVTGTDIGANAIGVGQNLQGLRHEMMFRNGEHRGMRAQVMDINDLLSYTNYVHDAYFSQVRAISAYFNRVYWGSKFIGNAFTIFCERNFFSVLETLENTIQSFQAHDYITPLRIASTRQSALSPSTPVDLLSPAPGRSVNQRTPVIFSSDANRNSNQAADTPEYEPVELPEAEENE